MALAKGGSMRKVAAEFEVAPGTVQRVAAENGRLDRRYSVSRADDRATGRQAADDSKGSGCRSRPGRTLRDCTAPKSRNSKIGVLRLYTPSTKDIG